MDYYRFGTTASMGAPGGVVLLGLIGKLRGSAGSAPEQLLLVAGHMKGGIRAAPARHACEFLVHVVEGSVLARVGAEEARLITDNSVRIPAGVPYQLSTEGSLGMTALVIAPGPGDTPRASGAPALPAFCGEALSIEGGPRTMDTHSLGILGSLTHLTSDGCVLPAVQVVRGNFYRDVVLASLLPQYAGDPLALRAFIWACNAHPAATWWLDRQRAKTAIEAGVAKLLAS